MILLQQLLASATQPSPVKAIFDKQELEVHAASPGSGGLCVVCASSFFEMCIS